jgi:hypothetical protein
MINELRLAFDEASDGIDPDPGLLGTLRRAHSRRQRRQRLVLVLAVLTVAGALALTGASLLGHHAGAEGAYAATPPVLHYTLPDNAPSAHDLLLQLADKAAAQPQPASGRYDYIETRGWYLDTSVSDGKATVSLDPDHRQEWVAIDGSGRIVNTLAGKVSDDTVPNNNYPGGLQGRKQLPTDPSALRAELAKNHPSYGTFEWFVAVSDTWKAQVVTPQVEAALLRMIAGEPDMKNSGTVTDRVGRRGVAVSTESNHSGSLTRYTLIFDPSTGALLDYEETQLEAESAAVTQLSPNGSMMNTPPLRLRMPATLSYDVFLKTGRVDSTDLTP